MRREGGAWSWRLAGGLGLAVAMAWGCGGGGSGSATAPTGAAAVTVTEDAPTAKSVTVDLRDRFLYIHNAQFFGGRTFRWAPLIPTFVLTGDPAVDDPVVSQFAAWEAAMGRRLFELRPASPQIPPRGIFIGVAELPGTVIGFANLLDAPSSVWLQALQAHFARLSGPAPRRRVEAPEILGNGQILRWRRLRRVRLRDPAPRDRPLHRFLGSRPEGTHGLRHQQPELLADDHLGRERDAQAPLPPPAAHACHAIARPPRARPHAA
jgi:hypothetical protein